jgi:hypothetical protein
MFSYLKLLCRAQPNLAFEIWGVFIRYYVGLGKLILTVLCAYYLLGCGNV